MQIYKLTEACCVAGQIQPADIAALKNEGFVTVVCNRPDSEDVGQPTAASIAAECANHDVAFHHLPVSNTGISPAMIEEFQKIVAASDGPVLAYCRSAQRSSMLWQYSGSP